MDVLIPLASLQWVDCHDAIILFEELQSTILNALDKITLWTDSDTSSMKVILLLR